MENLTLNTENTTNLLPIVPLRGKVAFPHTSISFEVGRKMTLKAIDRATNNGDRLVFIIAQKQIEKDEITPDDLYSVGCVAKVKQVAQLTGGAIRVMCEGLYRAKARVVSMSEADGCFYGVADPIVTKHGDGNYVMYTLENGMPLLANEEGDLCYVVAEGGRAVASKTLASAGEVLARTRYMTSASEVADLLFATYGTSAPQGTRNAAATNADGLGTLGVSAGGSVK